MLTKGNKRRKIPNGALGVKKKKKKKKRKSRTNWSILIPTGMHRIFRKRA
jgi:hypothetical protein